MDDTKKYVAKSFSWSIAAKMLNALIQFISVPLLLKYFGKENFGLITLAISVNAYLSLLEMGVNIGAIKYFSEWISQKNLKLLDSVARTSITFYGIIGIFNSAILIIVAFWGMHFFHISPGQDVILRNLFLILAVFSIINWSTSVFNQLLTANERIYYIQQINILKNTLVLTLLGLTLYFKLSLSEYFTWFTLINSIIIIPLYLNSKKHMLIRSLVPAFDWQNFGIVFKYSLAIIAMGIFQMSASQLRPVVLSIFSINGIGILSDYRVMETISMFIVSIGGIFISIFLPKTSKLLQENNNEEIRHFAYTATLYTSIIIVALAMPFILCGKEIITLYVGSEYIHLTPWLIAWIFTILFYLHNSPVASLVLATGKTRMLVYSSAIASIVSLLTNAIFCSSFEAGSAVLGYAVYIAIQMSFYYFYFNNKVLKLKSWKVFKSFIIPALLGSVALLTVWLMNIQLSNMLLQVILKSVIWVILFCGLLVSSKVLSIQKLRTIILSLK